MRRTPIAAPLAAGVLSAALVLAATPCTAGQGVAAPDAPGEAAPRVTEAEFLAPVVDEADDHPAVVTLRGDLETAQAEAIRAATLPDPVLSVMREEPSGGAEQIDLTLSWQPPRPDRRRLATGAADAGVEAAEARLRADHLALRTTLRAVYAEWALASRRLHVLERRGHRLAELAEREERRAEHGESSGLAARRLRLAAERAHADTTRARADATRAEHAARAFRPDLPPGAEPVAPPLPPADAGDGSVHPRVAALDAELRAARLEGELAARTVSLPELVAGWQTIDQAGGEVGGPLLGVVWSLPLLDRNRAERAHAAARASSTEARLELERRRLEQERAGALDAYRSLRTAALHLCRTAGSTAPVVDAAEAAFRLGESDLTDLLESLRSATETDLAALDLWADALAAHRELERGAGRPLGPSPGPTGRREDASRAGSYRRCTPSAGTSGGGGAQSSGAAKEESAPHVDRPAAGRSGDPPGPSTRTPTVHDPSGDSP